MDMNAVMAALGALVLERIDDDHTFVRRGLLPDWCFALPASALHHEGERFAVDAVFPFLASFLPEAEQAWCADATARRASGFWTETSIHGEELHLEASALRIGESALLVITRDEQLFQQQWLRLQRARELRLAHDALSREIEQKDVLLHTLVYDMASPLRRILSALSLLSETRLAEQSRDWARTAFAAAMQQKQMIGEILEVFSAEHAESLRAPAPENAPDLCRAIADVVDEFQSIVQLRTVTLQSTVCVAPCPVLAEPRRLERVLANLVGNAVRNSPAGGVVRIGIQRAVGFVEVDVDDDGPEVPVELLPRLFEKFAPSADRDHSTGLGLYFCRITLERWGGGAGYSRREQGGARFWIRLRTVERDSGMVG